jgi:excisionase family DNA binding protein
MPIYFAPKTHPNDLLDVNEIASTAEVSVRTVHRWITSGELPALQLGSGRRWYATRGVLQAFIDGRNQSRARPDRTPTPDGKPLSLVDRILQASSRL